MVQCWDMRRAGRLASCGGLGMGEGDGGNERRGRGAACVVRRKRCSTRRAVQRFVMLLGVFEP